MASAQARHLRPDSEEAKRSNEGREGPKEIVEGRTLTEENAKGQPNSKPDTGPGAESQAG